MVFDRTNFVGSIHVLLFSRWRKRTLLNRLLVRPTLNQGGRNVERSLDCNGNIRCIEPWPMPIAPIKFYETGYGNVIRAIEN